jgi:hypothetical protein
MKEKLRLALKAAVIAFVGAIAGGAVAPDLIQAVLALIGM